MTLPSSGPISLSDINTEFGLGNSLGSYIGQTWYTDGGGTGTFGSPLSFSDFYGKRSTSPFSIDYLVAGSGGGGGGAEGGIGMAGGGAGGQVLEGSTSFSTTTSYTITIGAGGLGSVSGRGSPGSSTIFQGGAFSLTAEGGGGGGSGMGDATSDSLAAYNTGGVQYGFITGTPTGGYSGGIGVYSGGWGPVAGGGGGAQGNGSGGSGPVGGCPGGSSGAGGTGVSSSISGSAVSYGAGGSGGSNAYPGGLCGGIAGNGGIAGGGNGGGAGSTSPHNGSNGANGIVIISYAGAPQFVGGVVTTVGSNTVHTFNASGTLTPINSDWIDYIALSYSDNSGIAVDPTNSYVYTTGAYYPGGGQLQVMKRQTNGQLLWQKKTNYSSNISASARNNQAIDSAGNTLIMGNTVYAGSQAIWLAKISPAGSIVWQSSLIDPAAYGIQGNGIAVDSSNNVYVVGHWVNSGSYYEGLVAKWDSNGNPLWQKLYKESAIRYTEFNGVTTQGTNVYVCGFASRYPSAPPGIVLKLNSSGAIVWQNGCIFGTSNDFKSISVNNFGLAFVTGYSYNSGNYSFVNAAFDEYGAYAWSRRIDNTYAGGFNIGIGTAFDGLYFYSYGYQSIFDTPPSSTSVASIFKYMANGNIVWQRGLRFANGTDDLTGIAIAYGETSGTGSIYLSGSNADNTGFYAGKLPADGSKTGVNGIWNYYSSSFADPSSGSQINTLVSASVTSMTSLDLGVTLSDITLGDSLTPIT